MMVKVPIYCFHKVKYTLISLFDLHSFSVPPPKQKMEPLSCVTHSAPFDMSSNGQQVMEENQVMSMRYKKEKRNLQSEKKSGLEDYLSDDCEEAPMMMHLKYCNFRRTNKRDILFLPKCLEMYLQYLFLLWLLSLLLALGVVSLILSALPWPLKWWKLLFVVKIR